MLTAYTYSNVFRTNAKERYQVETMAFQACSRIITDKLDVKSIVPGLNSHHLLTQKDHQFLINQVHEDHDKIQYILLRLPRKADGWFDKFLDCLCCTSATTGHGDIAKSLSEELKVVEIQNEGSAASVSNPIQVSSDDREVQSVADILNSCRTGEVCYALFVLYVLLEYLKFHMPS